MKTRCNFKIEYYGEMRHVHLVGVLCDRSEKGTYYTVIGFCALGGTVALAPDSRRHTELFFTPEEAFAFLDKIAEKYPRCGGDKSDFDIDFAPLYEGVEM